VSKALEEPLPSSETVTHGVRVAVKSAFLADSSNPEALQYAFTYTVVVTNEGVEPVTLLARHWIIGDVEGRREEVRGPGVVGFQPTIPPGQSFSYSSGAVLRAPLGTMHGTYLMERPDGSRFEANIAPFGLLPTDAIQ
jgi:ApaG protein